jgi:hypothetical protein
MITAGWDHNARLQAEYLSRSIIGADFLDRVHIASPVPDQALPTMDDHARGTS